MPAGELGKLVWHKSSACDPSECLEAASHGGHVLIRDSVARRSPVLEFPQYAWRTFLGRIAHDAIRYPGPGRE